MAGLVTASRVYPTCGTVIMRKSGKPDFRCHPRLVDLYDEWRLYYIMTNRRNGTLYVGVTSDLVRRCYEHRNGLIRGFTKQYDLKQLVYFEQHDDIRFAIQREKAIKHWPRAWKVRLIHEQNPEWRDLFDTLT